MRAKPGAGLLAENTDMMGSICRGAGSRVKSGGGYSPPRGLALVCVGIALALACGHVRSAAHIALGMRGVEGVKGAHCRGTLENQN